MKKRIMMFSSITALVTLLIAGGTMAWFTSNPKEVVNSFTAGTVNIGINENGFADVTNWNPGQTSKKDVDIDITSTKQTYVRAKLTPSWKNNDNVPLELKYVEIKFADTSKWVFADGTHPDATMNISDKRLAGYLYYTGIVTSANKSIHLIDSVNFLGTATNEYQGKKFTLGVATEGVQASHDAYKSTWNLQALPAGVEAWSAPTP